MRIGIPDALRSYTGAAEVIADGATVAQMFAALDAHYPGLRFRVIDEQGNFRRHMRCFVNGVQTFDLNGALSAQDEITIVQALSGG